MTYMKALSRKLVLFTLIILLSNSNITSVSADTITSADLVMTEFEYQPVHHKLIRVRGVNYVRIKESELKQLERQAFVNYSLLQRIRDLEKLYNDINGVVNVITNTINFVKKFLNIKETDIPAAASNGANEFKDISGTIMSPGFVEFSIKTTDATKTFDDLNLNALEMDIYYNTALFKIDHIEGGGVFGPEFKQIALPQKTSAAKDRIELPLSDVLNKSVNFKVYFSPRNPSTIIVGDKTNVQIKYFKLVPANTAAPLIYSLAPGSKGYIEVVVK